MNLKVSVIMPVYNAGEYLKTAVESILSQSLKEFELILVDDGSTDGSSERCDEYARLDSRVVVLHQKNGGICNARNAALQIARGEYIAFSDHDDEYLPGLLEKAYSATKCGSIDIVKFFKKNPVIKDGKIIRYQPQTIDTYQFYEKEIADNFLYLLNSGTLVCVWDGIYSRRLIKERGIQFNTTFKCGGEDIDFMLNMIKYASSITAIREVLYIHYLRIGFSTSSKIDLRKKDLERKNLEMVESLLQFWKIDIFNNVDYYYYVAKEYLCPLSSFIAKASTKMDNNIKKQLLDNIQTSIGVPSNFCNFPSSAIFRREKKIGLAHFLYKHHLYWLLINMFRLRLKMTN